MAKKTKLTGKCLYDIVVSKSKKFLEGLKIPFQKKNLKRQFESQVTNAASEFIDLKAEAIELLMEVKDVDVEALIDIKKQMKKIYEESLIEAEIYENLFGETLDIEIDEEDLAISASDVLSQAVEVDEDDED
jgi:hypothetical protein